MNEAKPVDVSIGIALVGAQEHLIPEGILEDVIQGRIKIIREARTMYSYT